MKITEFKKAIKKESKYGNKQVKIDGYTFDSKDEAKMYNELKLMDKCRLISDLEVHPLFMILAGFTDRDGIEVSKIMYEADFMFYDYKVKKTRVLDCKGFKTDVFKLKEKLFNRHFATAGLKIEYEI